MAACTTPPPETTKACRASLRVSWVVLLAGIELATY
jgi:hypothetical protein